MKRNLLSLILFIAFIGVSFIPKPLNEPKRVLGLGLNFTLLVNTNNETSQSSTTTGVSASAVGTDNIIVILVSADNRSTADGNTNDIQSVTDNTGGSNTYTKIYEYTNTVGGAAADGATVAAFYCVNTTAITTSTTWTVNYSGAIVAKMISVRTNTKTASTSVGIVPASVQFLTNDNADAGSMSISGESNIEHFWMRVEASETDNAGSSTATAGYVMTTIGASGSGGSEKGHVQLEFEKKLETSTGSTSDPTSNDATADRVGIFWGFYEYTPATPVRHMITLLQTGGKP